MGPEEGLGNKWGDVPGLGGRTRSGRMLCYISVHVPGKQLVHKDISSENFNSLCELVRDVAILWL